MSQYPPIIFAENHAFCCIGGGGLTPYLVSGGLEGLEGCCSFLEACCYSWWLVVNSWHGSNSWRVARVISRGVLLIPRVVMLIAGPLLLILGGLVLDVGCLLFVSDFFPRSEVLGTL